jgi:hypothetical protein
MKIISKILKTANITIVGDKLHTSFLSSSFFDFLPKPQNIVQIPNFGLLDFDNCNFVVDVDNRRVFINHKIGDICQSSIPKMAQKFINEVKEPELVTMGMNFTIDITFDSDFGKYSIDQFLNEKYKKVFNNELSGIGIKAFIKKANYNITILLEPSILESSNAILTTNFHYKIQREFSFESEFIERYNDLEGYINGIFS